MELPVRKLPRLRGYDYSSENYYFITICTHQKKCLFANGKQLTALGRIAQEDLLEIPLHFEGVKLDKHVVMPNHIHAIIAIGCDNQAERSRPFPTLSTIVGLYKSGVSRKIREMRPGVVVWQKSFHDIIIRNTAAYEEIWNYIDENPLKWELDEFYTA